MNNLVNRYNCCQIYTLSTQIQVLYDLKNYELKKTTYILMELVKYARHTSLEIVFLNVIARGYGEKDNVIQQIGREVAVTS